MHFSLSKLKYVNLCLLFCVLNQPTMSRVYTERNNQPGWRQVLPLELNCYSSWENYMFLSFLSNTGSRRVTCYSTNIPSMSLHPLSLSLSPFPSLSSTRRQQAQLFCVLLSVRLIRWWTSLSDDTLLFLHHRSSFVLTYSHKYKITSHLHQISSL